MISNIGEGATPLMYACQQSRESEVLDILARKRNAVRERDRTMKTPLHYCTENASIGCAEAVLRAAPELLDAKDEDGYTALHLAVIAGNKTFLRFLIARGANVNALDNEKHSSIHWATVCGEEEALEIVLRAGADISTPDIHGGYPLHYAAQMCGPGGDMGRDPKIGLRILNILLSHKIDINVTDKDGRQPILWAASAGSADAVLALVKAGASVEASDKDGLTALHCAASRGHSDCIETLVTLCGANIDVIDSNGCTALFYAVTLGHADATQLLLSLGAEPNRQDRKGRTPAHCGAAKGQLETLRLLENYGANLWLRNVKGDFPLHEAVASGRRELVRWLLNQRPDAVNVGNNDGRCPIHIAAINNNIEMAKILFDAQSLVNPIMRTTKGNLMTPLDAALHRSFRGCAKYLQLHGGVPFAKLTEKSSSIKAVSSRQVTSDVYISSYNDREWELQQTSSAFLPSQIRLGSDAAIQHIETTGIRTRYQTGYDDDARSSDEEKVQRRRRRRKKSEHHRKGYISEEDSNFEDREVEMPRRKQKTVVEEHRQKREQYGGSSSEDFYKKKAIRKNESTSDSEERIESRRSKNYERRRHRSEESENDGKRKRKSRKDSSPQRVRVAPENQEEEKTVELAKEKEVTQMTVVEVHSRASPDEAEIEKVNSESLSVEEKKEVPVVKVEEVPEVVQEDAAKEEEVKVQKNEEEEKHEDQDNERIVLNVPQIEVTKEESEEEQPALEDVNEGLAEEEESGEVVENEEEPKGVTEERTEVLEIVEKAEEAVISEAVPYEEPQANEEEKVEEVGEENKQDEKEEQEENEEVLPEEVEEKEVEAEEVEEHTAVDDDEQKDEGLTIEEVEEEENEENEEEEEVVEKEGTEFMESAFQVLSSSPERTPYVKKKRYLDDEVFRRNSKEYREGDVEGSMGDESGGSTRNEDSSALLDSGIEPSPRRKLRDSSGRRSGSTSGLTRTRVPRLCNRGKDPEEIHAVSVTQTVQNTIRKYHIERRIFYQLLELKRLQIRAGRANEQVLVKRLVDEYRRGGIVPGLRNYNGQYTFRQFEKFLYDQLRTLQSTAHVLIPKLRPSDDIETLSTILRKSRVELVDDIPDNPIFCTQGTHRCHHAAHAYTGIPCAAYITKFNHHEMPKNRTGGFLPQIEQATPDRGNNYRPVTLELSHGKEKQVISLPTDRLDKNKRYYVTFTIKGVPSIEDRAAREEERILQHRHAKSF